MSARNWIRKGARVQIGNGVNTKVWYDPWIPDLKGEDPKIKQGVDRSSIRVVAELGNREGAGWDVERIKHFFTEEEAGFILKILWPDSSSEDRLLWCDSNARGFSVSSCYKLNRIVSGEQEDETWSKLWKMKLHIRLKFFLWRIKARVIPTREELVRRMGSGELHCPICGVEEETLFHVLKECHGARRLAFASSWGFRLDIWEVSNVDDIINFCIDKGESIEGGREGRRQTVFLCSLFYCCWFFRNKVVHEGGMEFDNLVSMLNNMVELYLKAGDNLEPRRRELAINSVEETGWTPPIAGWYKVNTDAAFKNGMAAIGVVARDERGEVILILSRTESCLTARAAELSAVVWATEVIGSKGWNKVQWCVDAADIVEAINDEQVTEAWDLRRGISDKREKR